MTDNARTPHPEHSQVQQHIRLDHFLKLLQFVESGGHAKVLIQSGLVKVNGTVCTARKRKVYHNDEIEIDGEQVTVNID
ncbi:MAG: RNA-binding S4 domain-containing protein [Planctomycetota bacterium]|nr:RNA-binding S4 domain-containing protein [Planctomycetota bacterium]